MAYAHRDFMGSKLALFVGSKLLVLQRDDTPGLLWPGFWDLAGGGREGSETPIACALRETSEEFSLIVPPAQITWGRAYTNSIERAVWFFVGWVPHSHGKQIVLGDEGQGWALMSRREFMQHKTVVPQFKARLGDYDRGVISEAYKKDPPSMDGGR